MASLPLQLKRFLHAQHGRVFLVLDLDPAFRRAGAVGQIDPLADNALQPKLAGVFEDHGAVALKVFDVFCRASPMLFGRRKGPRSRFAGRTAPRVTSR